MVCARRALASGAGCAGWRRAAAAEPPRPPRARQGSSQPSPFPRPPAVHRGHCELTHAPPLTLCLYDPGLCRREPLVDLGGRLVGLCVQPLLVPQLALELPVAHLGQVGVRLGALAPGGGVLARGRVGQGAGRAATSDGRPRARARCPAAGPCELAYSWCDCCVLVSYHGAVRQGCVQVLPAASAASCTLQQTAAITQQRSGARTRRRLRRAPRRAVVAREVEGPSGSAYTACYNCLLPFLLRRIRACSGDVVVHRGCRACRSSVAINYDNKYLYDRLTAQRGCSRRAIWCCSAQAVG